jgi:hypothetical protein
MMMKQQLKGADGAFEDDGYERQMNDLNKKQIHKRRFES